MHIAAFFPNSRVIVALHGGHGVIGPIERNQPNLFAALLDYLQTGNMDNLPARTTLPLPKFAVPDFPSPAAKVPAR